MTTGAGGTSAAVQIAETGGPEVMQVIQRADPAPGEGETAVAARLSTSEAAEAHRLRQGRSPAPRILLIP